MHYILIIFTPMSPTSKLSTLTYQPAQSWVLSLLPIQWANYSWEWDLPWSVVDLPGVTALPRADSPSPSSYPRPIAGFSCLLSYSLLGLWFEVVQVFCVASQSLWAHRCDSSCVQKTLFPWIHSPSPLPSLLLSFPLPVPRKSLSLTGSAVPWKSHLGMSTSQSS